MLFILITSDPIDIKFQSIVLDLQLIPKSHFLRSNRRNQNFPNFEPIALSKTLSAAHFSKRYAALASRLSSKLIFELNNSRRRNFQRRHRYFMEKVNVFFIEISVVINLLLSFVMCFPISEKSWLFDFEIEESEVIYAVRMKWFIQFDSRRTLPIFC